MEHLNLTSGITSASKDWRDIITQRGHVRTKNIKTAWTQIDCLFSFDMFFPKGKEIKQEHIFADAGYTLAHAPHIPSDFFILQRLGCHEHPDIIILQIKES